MRITFDATRCEGHGRCYDQCPEAFEPDDVGHARLTLTGDVPARLEADVRRAADYCPERAITIAP